MTLHTRTWTVQPFGAHWNVIQRLFDEDKGDFIDATTEWVATVKDEASARTLAELLAEGDV